MTTFLKVVFLGQIFQFERRVIFKGESFFLYFPIKGKCILKKQTKICYNFQILLAHLLQGMHLQYQAKINCYQKIFFPL